MSLVSSVPSLFTLATSAFHPAASVVLTSTDFDLSTLEMAAEIHQMHTTHHLRGRTAFRRDEYTVRYMYPYLTDQEKYNYLTNKLTGVAKWTRNGDRITIHMDSPVIYGFWIEFVITTQQLRLSQLDGPVAIVKVKGCVNDTISRLVASVCDGIVRIDDELTPAVWIETDVPSSIEEIEEGDEEDDDEEEEGTAEIEGK